MGSPEAYEATQKRILGVFQHWQFPETIKVREFLVHAGHWGGVMVIETDDLSPIHKLTTALPGLSFQISQAMEVADAVGLEAEAIAWRDSLADAPE